MPKKTSAVEATLRAIQNGGQVSPELLQQAIAEFSRIKSVIGNTRTMRAAQKKCHETFSQTHLVEAKQWEKETDKSLEALWERVETAKQESLFPAEGSHA